MNVMNPIHLVVFILGVVVGEAIAENTNNGTYDTNYGTNNTNYGTILIGFISESAEDEQDGVEHIEGYFQYLYDASGDLTPRRLNVTTFRMDVVEKNRGWLKLSQDFNSLISKSPAMIIGSYRRVIDQLLPPNITYIVTGSKAFQNNIDIRRSKSHENVCWSTDVGSNVISLLPPLNTFLNPLQMFLMKTTGLDNIVVVIVQSEDDLLHFNSGLWTGSASTESHFLQFVRVMIRKNSDYWGIIDKLVAVQKLATPHIVIHSYDLKYINNIIDGAKDLNMVTYLYRWYLTYPDLEGIGDELSTFFLGHYSNVTGFQLVDSDMLNQAMPLRGNGLDHAIIYDAMKILVDTLPRQQKAALEIEDFFDTLKSGFNGSTGSYGEVSLINLQTKERQFCRIRSSYEWMAFEGGELTQIGTYLHDNDADKKRSLSSLFTSRWLRPKRFELKEPIVKYKAKPKDLMPIFNNMPVSVVAVDDPPMAILNPDGTFTGVMVDYLNEYAQKLNFTYEITKLIRHDEDGGGQRYIYPHSTMWTGAVGDILVQDAVLAIGAIGTTIEREVVMDFSETTFPGVISMMAKKPSIEYDTWQFLSPFSWKMWVGIGVVLIVVSIVVTFLDLLDKTTHDFKNFPVRDSFYYTASILFFGSTDQRPNSAPMRLLIGFFVFFAIVVSQSYVANMAAFLTTRRSDESLPRSIDALSRQSAVPFGLMARGEAMAMLARATKGPYLYLRNKFEVEGISHPKAPPEGDTKNPGKSKARRFFSYDEAIATVKNGSFILISESPITRYFVHKDCELVVVDQDTDSIRYSIGMPKGALFRRELDRAITEVREEVSRDIDIMEKWYAEPDCAKGGGDTMQANMKTKPLIWEEMQGLFITLGIGTGLALVSAVIGHFITRVINLQMSKRKPQVDGDVRRGEDQTAQERPTETARGPNGGLGRGTKGMSSPGTSARARPLHLTPMMRPRSDREDSDDEQ